MCECSGLAGSGIHQVPLLVAEKSVVGARWGKLTSKSGHFADLSGFSGLYINEVVVAVAPVPGYEFLMWEVTLPNSYARIVRSTHIRYVECGQLYGSAVGQVNHAVVKMILPAVPGLYFVGFYEGVIHVPDIAAHTSENGF